jgi:hypothetical protein
VAEVGQDATQHCDRCAITTCMYLCRCGEGFFLLLLNVKRSFTPRDEGETRARGKTNNHTSLHMESPLTTRGQCSPRPAKSLAQNHRITTIGRALWAGPNTLEASTGQHARVISTDRSTWGRPRQKRGLFAEVLGRDPLALNPTCHMQVLPLVDQI